MFKVQISGKKRICRNSRKTNWMENQDLKELQTEMFAILLYVVEMSMINAILMFDVQFGAKKHQDFFME